VGGAERSPPGDDLCARGAEITEQLEARAYKGTIRVQVGPIVTNYKGELQVERLDAQSYSIELVGKGRDIKGKGSASMRMTGQLRALAEGGTEVTGTSQLTISGRLAQFGGRMIEDVSDQMFAQFTHNLAQRFQAPAEPEAHETQASTPEPIKVLPMVLTAVWTALVGFLRRLVGRSRPA
jgi:uncharacterized protein